MNVKSNPSFTVISPGMLTTIQDCGRFRQGHLGITTGGAADNNAFVCANQLLKNSEDAPALEINFGGLQLIANSATTIAITGAQAPISINGEVKANWQCHHLNKNDKLDIGFATSGCRIYLAVSGGFIVPSQFGSTSTVIREKIGGFDGGAIKTGQILPIGQTEKIPLNKINSHYIPKYSNQVNLRVITGYQISSFSRQQVNKFFASEYQVSSQSDRMGYRLNGPKITSEISSMYSEGICQGAIQIPPDGQPIVLANDRQTIGGYPKLGSVLSIDLNNLMQSPQGTKIHFEPISIHCAHTLLHLAKAKLTNVPLIQGMS